MRFIFLSVIILASFILEAQVAITIPSEFEKNDKLVLSWSYIDGIDSIIGEITGIAKQVVEVDIIYAPDSLQFDTTQIRNFLGSMGVNSQNVFFIPASTNTCWIRQYSPVTGYGVFDNDLVLYLGNPEFSDYNQPNNDSVPTRLASHWNMDIADYGLKFENTNIQYDGLHNLFVGENIVVQNSPMDENAVKFALNSYFNSGEVIFTPSLLNSGGGALGGINNYMKILDFETILVSAIPDTLPDYDIIEDFISELSLVTNKFGGNYNIIRVMSAPNADGKYPTSQEEEIRSYTNSLILNNLIIMPSYGIPEFDSAAYRMYKKYMSGYDIYMVDSRLLSINLAGINTIAKEIPQTNFLRILHEKNIGPQTFSSNYEILCLASASEIIEEMWLYYKINNDEYYTKTYIEMVCPQHFGVIDGLSTTDIVDVEINKVSSSQFSIAPNPSSGEFKISSNDLVSEMKVSIYNLQGQLILSTQSYSGVSIFTGDKLEVGYYNLIVSQGGISSKLKLVVFR